ncbi:carboxymethylenebutenolidase homolog isoform X2 [Hemicordylus capensis]|uniref:carboxymethylenebutenolidase homolog isoform X2 n=1 Tax=Hemicordylus capensis TaxID=884348 RepID=UPI0023028D8E|nr:carboxymethylenebutenolidase homolog isoform X2 [Hemicordylus capensis]
MANEAKPCPCDIGDKLEYEGLGQEVSIEHIKAYINKPALSTDKAVIVIHDIFGWQLSNTRYIADMLAAHGYMETDVALKYLKQQCNVKKIGVIGFCWGGAAVHHLMLRYAELKAGVSIYGVIKFSEDNYSLLNPTFFIFGEKDDIIPLDQVTVLEQKLKQQCKVDFEVKVYRGQTHGFVHRKKEDINPQDKPYIEEARKDMLNWLNKYI